jgi:hypothetical protein
MVVIIVSSCTAGLSTAAGTAREATALPDARPTVVPMDGGGAHAVRASKDMIMAFRMLAV